MHLDVGLGPMVLQTTHSLPSRKDYSRWVVLCERAWGFPWLSFPSGLICLDLSPTSAVVSAIDILLGAREIWPKASEKHFSWFPLGLFLIVQDSWGIALLSNSITGYHRLFLLLAILLLCPLSVPQGRALAHHLNCKSSDLMLFAGSEATFFFLAHRSPRNRGRK